MSMTTNNRSTLCLVDRFSCTFRSYTPPLLDATCNREAHRQLLRKLFALVVRANMAVQTRNAAMQYAPPGSCTAGELCARVIHAVFCCGESDNT